MLYNSCHTPNHRGRFSLTLVAACIIPQWNFWPRRIVDRNKAQTNRIGSRWWISKVRDPECRVYLRNHDTVSIILGVIPKSVAFFSVLLLVRPMLCRWFGPNFPLSLAYENARLLELNSKTKIEEGFVANTKLKSSRYYQVVRRSDKMCQIYT